MNNADTTAIISGVLGIVSFVYPPAAPVIAILEKAAPYIVMAIPLVEAAVKEGASAFEAAREAAPELTTAIAALVPHLQASGTQAFGSNGNPDVVAENLTRSIFGFHQMTFAEELKWMDGTTGNGNNTGGA